MGGMLATGALSLGGYLSRHIRSLTMLGSGCFGTGSWHSLLKPTVSLLCRFGFPGRIAGSFVSALIGTKMLALVEAAFYWPSNMTPSVAKKLMRSCFRFIPHGLVSQFMESMNTPEGLTTANGLRYCDPKALRHVHTPVLGVTGDWDLFCPAPGGLRTVQHFGGEHRRFVFLGPAYGTAKTHYAHFDVIMGRNAIEEVWPYVTTFLAEHDKPEPTGGMLSEASSLTACSELSAPLGGFNASAADVAAAAAAAAAEAAEARAVAAEAAAAAAKAAAAEAKAAAAQAAAAVAHRADGSWGLEAGG